MTDASITADHPTWLTPMLATLTDDRFSDPQWLYERKLDGERCLAYCHGDRVRLLTRNQKSAATAYPEIVDALHAQGLTDAVLDGEVVAFTDGQTDFAKLQGRMQVSNPQVARRSRVAVFYYVFDLLHYDGHDIRRLPLRERKSLLRKVIRFDDPLRLSRHRTDDGIAFYEEGCRKGWEGVIAKRADAPYHAGRSRDWLKFKCSHSQEMVIGGFTDPQGSRPALGALLVGYFDGDDLVYAGKVGTGFSHSVLGRLRRQLDEVATDHSPFGRNEDKLPRTPVHWVRPQLVADIGYAEWTTAGLLRHPRFHGLRRDKEASSVVRER